MLQVGLIVVMNQIGSLVPCSRATLPIFHQILCRVGASDIQLRGVSTFLAEMVEAAAILKTANARSLAIIDELGRGTSTHNGFGIAYAIMVELITRARCFTLCATHFKEMAALTKYPGVVTRHFTAQRVESGKLVFLYKVQDGVCEHSYAINVAEIAKMPPPVIESARNKLLELQSAKFRSGPLVQALHDATSFAHFTASLAPLLETA
ncbi:bifunctional P-loop containing nucleoside triphosphate hydrolase/DNA mismatch repair protein MutS [Babesia duncani]|uniref:Bifunctional P-loop containing nucleoside triphosphate hydrolase/DNA mismatch repair protein MutS n=1 Tax=Babesia duncani TaxID=323732 RepID=A0AAD9PN64_9APIC|nr:bifunctional P-loop containing nucleoside triphosphate hydrolase/DNA mismatch repair protein MutS [Babesia duncani]